MIDYTPKNYSFNYNTPTYEKGNYFIVDPCYVIGAEPFWGNLCNELLCTEDFNKSRFATLNAEGYDIFILITEYGDGVYPVRSNKTEIGEAGVDAGMLCVIPMEFIDKFCNGDTKLGVVANLESKSTPVYENGILIFGNITVNTAYEEEDEEEEFDEEQYWINAGFDEEFEEDEIDDFALEIEETLAYDEKIEMDKL